MAVVQTVQSAAMRAGVRHVRQPQHGPNLEAKAALAATYGSSHFSRERISDTQEEWMSTCVVTAVHTVSAQSYSQYRTSGR